MAAVCRTPNVATVQEHCVTREEYGGHWVRPQPFDLRYVDLPPRLAMEQPGPSPRIRMWWRPTESVPDDPVLHSCLLA